MTKALKSLAAVILCGILILSAAGCEKNNVSSNNSEIIIDIPDESQVSSAQSDVTTESEPADENTGASQTATESNNSTVSSVSKHQESVTSDTEEPDTSVIPDSECRKLSINEWKNITLKSKLSEIKLQLQIPSDWKLISKSTTEYTIQRNGKQIGVITTVKPAALKDYQEDFSHLEVGAAAYMGQGYNASGEYCRSFEYISNYADSTFAVYIRVNFTELNSNASFEMCSEITSGCDWNFLPLEKTNSSKKILILGNSFINTSLIGNFLNSMLSYAGNGYSCEAVSRGNAEINTYAKDTAMLNRISSGEFCYVFICGFYSDEAVSTLPLIVSRCNESSTGIAAFPAHNENESVLASGINNNKGLYCLNWRQEINDLIASGISYDDFCVDDIHKHSKPLAGYVGAHMIYRTLFNEMPPSVENNAQLSQNEINVLLGDYADSGIIAGKIDPEIYLFY